MTGVIDADAADPQPEAPIEAWRSWIGDLVLGGCFSARRWSWVCARDRYFLKIPRVTGQPEPELGAFRAEAEGEYRLTRQLTGQLNGLVEAPLRLIDACIVKRRLRGPDLWRLAQREGGTPEVQAALSQGLVLAARLHRLDPATVPDLPVHDYARDPILPAPEELHERLRRRPRTIVVGGLEVRNFMQDLDDGQWKFFDPHEAVLGAPEDDVARYILSLLMIDWGRHARCRIWTRFGYQHMLRAYEAARGECLDQQLLAYMFQRNIARRRNEARASTRDLPWFTHMAACAYERLFFWQVREWGSRHGL